MLSARAGVSRRLGSLSRLPKTGGPSKAWICRACSASSPGVNGPDLQRRLFHASAQTCNAAVTPSTDKTDNRPPMQQNVGAFAKRHIGPDAEDVDNMLQALSPPIDSLKSFVAQVIPPDIMSNETLYYTGTRSYGLTEVKIAEKGQNFARRNRQMISFLGTGYYGTHTPEVIKRNVLENPAWYTSYTPYQPEISQGRLESLLNFQTLVTDMTALPVANASLLDEGTAAAEAMSLSFNALPLSRTQRPGRTFIVSHLMHPQTIAVLRGRAEGFGIKLDITDVTAPGLQQRLRDLGDDLVGVMVQYPDTRGGIEDFSALAQQAHERGVLLSCATDLLALTLLIPPGEWGADIAFGSAQRLGVPMGFGGPHAGFFAVADKHKRKMPGRLIGVSKDRLGNRALRLALQTREQHIRREKATSNVCTAQALLANISAFYAIYHGPAGLKEIAQNIVKSADYVAELGTTCGWQVAPSSSGNTVRFDTVVLSKPGGGLRMRKRANGYGHPGLLVRVLSKDEICISVDETTDWDSSLSALTTALVSEQEEASSNKASATEGSKPQLQHKLPRNLGKNPFEKRRIPQIPHHFRRKSSFLTHPVFNTHHSETEMMRYIHHLESKDLSLVHSMIPLGSCTMKLNAATEMALISLAGFANVHPHTPARFTQGYGALVNDLTQQLGAITGMPSTGVSLQPNSGAQGEFAGLRAIRQYHEARGDNARDICLIPVSAHGTNPASAAMAGLRVVPIKCDAKTGNLDLSDLRAKCEKHKEQLAAIMVTYPSTFGVFEPHIKEVCAIVHQHGGQVYMDGANMNAQIGLCSPGEIGADVCHLNLHKTFCIPHGGGGPGVGPICVKEHLVEYLPTTAPVVGAEQALISSAAYGSAGILPISWAYNALMGPLGLTHATKITLLNANYLMSKLRPHYQILYTNEHGRCAHEFILDVRPFRESAGVEAIDIAKRLQDYGFHAPTMSWPVANTLMIEPTESESKEELDRFIEALVSIREEIREVEEGSAPRAGNVLKMSPHPMQDIILGDGGDKWTRVYSREKAAYPLPWLKEKKFWPTVARIDDTYGDMNLFCTCPPVEDTTGGNLSSVQEN